MARPHKAINLSKQDIFALGWVLLFSFYTGRRLTQNTRCVFSGLLYLRDAYKGTFYVGVTQQLFRVMSETINNDVMSVRAEEHHRKMRSRLKGLETILTCSSTRKSIASLTLRSFNTYGCKSQLPICYMVINS